MKSTRLLFVLSLILGLGVMSPWKEKSRTVTADESEDALDDYYANINTQLTGDDFIALLSERISAGYQSYPYTSADETDVWDILAAADEDPDNEENIRCIYSGLSIPKNCQDGIAPAGSAYVWNREHLWCKSHGFPKESDSSAYTDCHHLHASEKVINTTRNNLDFDEKENYETYTSYGDLQGKSYGAGNYYGSAFFEPRDEVKGDIARSLLYMCVRYNDDNLNLILTDNVPTQGSANGLGKLGKFETILKWNYEDPVSEEEKKRNDVVYSYQHNRNPFIDHNEYVSLCWPNTYAGTAETNPSSSMTEPEEEDPDAGLTTVYQYTKIENDPVNWEGEYIVVNEAKKTAFNSNLATIDVANNYVSLTDEEISGNTIETAKLANKTVQIKPYGTGYSIETYGGLYIGNTVNNKNRIDSSADAKYLNTLSMASDGVDIIAEAGAHLRYATPSSGARFRYYQPSTYTNQNPVSLYRIIEEDEENVIMFDSCGGSTVDSEVIPTLGKLERPENPTKEDYRFDGWYTDEACTMAYDFDNIVYSNFTLYAKWSKDEFLQEIQDAMDATHVSARFDLNYTKEDTKAYRKVTSASQIEDGASIILASHLGEKDYAVSAAAGSANKSLAPVEVSVSNDVCTTEDTSVLWTVKKNGDYLYLCNEASGNYISTVASGTEVSLYSVAQTVNKNHFADIGNGNIGYVIDGASVSQNALMLRQDGEALYFKNYKVSNLGGNGYAESIAIYQWTDISNVSLKLQVRFEMNEELLSNGTCTDIGFTYTSGSTSAYYSYTDLKKTEENGAVYYVYEEDLGDVINGASLSLAERKIVMSCVNNEVTYTSEIAHKFTIRGLAQNYLEKDSSILSDRLIQLLEDYIALTEGE